MKRIYFTVSCFAVLFCLSAQPAAPIATPLGAYAQSLQSPARVAVDLAGSVYVTDPTAGQVSVFDAFGRLVTTHAGLARPLGIAVDAQAKIYLAEEQLGRVSVFDSQWDLLYRLGQGDGEFQLPNHIALDPASAGSAVYVSDSQANLIKVYVGPTLTRWFGAAGSGDGQFDFPSGVCVSTNGEVFVVDQGNDRIQVFGLIGNFLRAFNLGNSAPSGRSQAAFFDPVGRLYVADSFQGLVKVFDPASGNPLSTIGSFGQLPGELASPAGLALDGINRLFVTSANSHRVELYGLDTFVHLTTQPAARTIAAGTNLVFTASTGGGGLFSYQWQKNGIGISGATNETLALIGVTTETAGNYSVIVTGTSGTFTSSIAPVAVMMPPIIVSSPENRTVWRGSDVVLATSTAGSALSYQWWFNGFNLAGATDVTLNLADVQAAQAGLYTLQASNAVGVAVSAAAQLNVIVSPAVMEIVASAMDTNQLFHLTLNVDPGFGYWLDASTNLFEWQPLLNFTQDTGLIELVDTDATNYLNRFYRLRWVP